MTASTSDLENTLYARQTSVALLADGKSGVMRQTGTRPERQLQARLQVEEGDRAMLEFPADDALRAEAESIAVEPHRPVQVVHPECDERDPRLHEGLA
jgi:hypothetical protein